MLRSHTCGELRASHAGSETTLCGWVQKTREMGGMTFVDLRDRYGITQLVFNDETDKALNEKARTLGREFVIKATGQVAERSNKNPNLPTGEVEILVSEISVLNESKTPPFTIEEETDGGEELRMQYRYLDLRRKPLQENIALRHKLGNETRNYLSGEGFVEIETPVLLKSTPEGARDFVVPSRMNEGEFYALPQSPQTFKQLLMVSGYDKYFQIVKCFRDEDLRADRQPEFTQIDCELSFVERDDVLATFEGLTKHIFKALRDIDLPEFPVMKYEDAMRDYGNDKPDVRFEMKLANLNEVAQGKGFNVFDQVESVLGICVPGCGEYTRKQLDELTEWVKRPQIGMKGLVWVKWTGEGLKSSVDKFYSEDDLKSWAELMGAREGDLLLVLAGDDKLTRFAASELRLEMGERLGLRDKDTFKPLWVVDFPLLDFDEETDRWHAMHHPFTSPKEEDKDKLATDPGNVSADAYDLVINGVEIGGGSIRIHNRELQQTMFDTLGFTKEEAEEQFGFLMGAFEYGAPPHGGIAFGFDRLCAVLAGVDAIRDFIAFPKNNAGRDVMLDAPSKIDGEQLKELKLKLDL